MKVKRILIASGILTVIVVSGIGYYSWNQNFRPLPFDPREWARGSEQTRGRMIEDLLSRDLVRMHKTELTNLLGEPDIRSKNGRDYYYSFHRYSPLNPYSESFVVVFDPARNIVTKTFTMD